MKRNKNIGSISHGTLRPEDLIPAMVDTLRDQKPMHKGHRRLCTEAEHALNIGSDDIIDYANDLAAMLDEYAPPYFYFGAHPGDGSDFGFWLHEHVCEDFDGLKINAGDSIPKGYTGELLEVTDHGNLTLYTVFRGRKRLVWSVV